MEDGPVTWSSTPDGGCSPDRAELGVGLDAALELLELLLRLLSRVAAAAVMSSCGSGGWPFRSCDGVSLLHIAVVSPLNPARRSATCGGVEWKVLQALSVALRQMRDHSRQRTAATRIYFAN